MISSLVASFLLAQLLNLNLTAAADNFLPPFKNNIEENFAGKSILENNQSFNWSIFLLASPLPKEPVKIIKDGIESVGPVVTAGSAILIDSNSGKILWEKDSGKVRSIASITKLMTALVFVEHNPGWDKKIVIKPEYNREGGALKVSSANSISLRDVFNAMLVGSLNNAAIALVDATGMSLEEFVAEMNKKAIDLGLEKTRFVEPTGLSADNVATARDLAKILKAAVNKSDIQTAISAKSYSIYLEQEDYYYHISNTDQLLWSYLNAGDYQILGAKTGYIAEAGYCFTVDIKTKKGQELVGVVLNSANYDSRFQEMKGMTQWALDNYQW